MSDWYLARSGYKSQQTDEPADPNRPNNLWQPLAGAHGRFDARATNWSTQLWATTHRGWLAATALLLSAVAYGALGRNGEARG